MDEYLAETIFIRSSGLLESIFISSKVNSAKEYSFCSRSLPPIPSILATNWRHKMGKIADLDSKNCAQIVPKICQEYQNVSKNIEGYRTVNRPKKSLIICYFHYFLGLTFLRCFLHTVEVTGSNPVSPTTPFPMRCPASPFNYQGDWGD
jgi:hypothetical protein